MARIKSILVIAFLIVFAAGLMVGMVRGRSTATATSVSSAHSDRASFLTTQLNLSPDQEEKIHKIWSEVMKSGPAGGQHMSDLDKERDDSIRAMLSEDQKSKYDQIIHDYRAKADAMHAEMHKRIDEAERRTREILTDSQRVKYDEITKERHNHPHEGGHMHGGFTAPPPPPGTQPFAP